jgi:glucosamine-6-phosphate deaminase
MRVLVVPSEERACAAVAQFIARTLRSTPDVVLGLPTGRTMVPVYDELVRLHRRRLADFRRATTFNLDEFAGVRSEAAGSYHTFMKRHLFDKVNLPRASTHFPHSAGGHPERYDRLIDSAGGMDVCVVGLGSNGHVGFNEPGTSLVASTHRVTLQPATRRANAYLFGGKASSVPSSAFSMGIGTILRSRAILLLVTGANKAGIVKRALAGRVTTRVPASLLQAHPNCVVVLDRFAAAGLKSR